MKFLFFMLLVSLPVSMALGEAYKSASGPDKAWITLDQNTYKLLKTIAPAAKSHAVRSVANGLKINGKPAHDSIHIVQVKTDLLNNLSRQIHEVKRHCGGYVRHASLYAAQISLKQQKPSVAINRPAYIITHRSDIEPMLQQMKASNIKQTILSLSDFQNRYYNSIYGAQASDWLLNQWSGIVSGRSDISVEQIFVPVSKQSSVVLTIKGNQLADEVVVLGGHLDSINHKDTIQPYGARRAPGADDNASGIASLTEVLRVLVANNYHPQRTIKFMAYAAEEVGLSGSSGIANKYAYKGVSVVGVLQLDMTNYKGSAADFYLVSDYTDSQQNSYLHALATAYLPALNVAYTECGYACSDHASWTRAGYAASFPFEAPLAESSPYRHTRLDTLANSDAQATNALKFARLALAYAVEMGDIVGGKVDDGSVNVLQNGVSVLDLSGNQGSMVTYTLDVPPGASDLLFTINDGLGDADLYVRFGAEPDTGHYACRPQIAGNTEECAFASPQSGSWYVMIHGYNDYAGVMLEGSYKGDSDACPTGNGKTGSKPGKSGSDCPSNDDNGGGSLGVAMLVWLVGYKVFAWRRTWRLA